MHFNGSRFFFFFIYLHVGRSLYYGTFIQKKVFFSGVTLLVILIATAFLGYVLPWGQISYWGATVITNLFSVIPIFGKNIVIILWGRFSVDQVTLSRFFSLHYLLPFIILIITLIHLIFLHESGSFNPLGFNRNFYKIKFHPYFLIKDTM